MQRLTLVLVVLLAGASVGACDLIGRTNDAAPLGSVQRARVADLPTAKEVATVYPGIRSREAYSYDPDPLARKRARCTDDWRTSAPFTAGRWSNYLEQGRKDPYFTGGEGVGVDVLSFASVQAAGAAMDSFSTYVDACLGHHSSGDGYDFSRRKLDAPDGFVGYLERFVVDMGTAHPTHDENLYLLTSRDEFLVGVRIQTDRIRPNQKRALQLARLARSVVGRAPEVVESVPRGAVLHDHRARPIFFAADGKPAAPAADLPPGFQKFVRAMAATVEKSVGDEYSIEDCASGIDVLMYRTDGYAQLGEVNCIGDGAPAGYLVANVDGAWKVIDEPAGVPNPGGDCAKLAKVHFPSSIVGSWCQDGSNSGHEYPTG